ncbi:MAG: MBL fold metallo-hydrolase [Lachnospiraceae bacterium]|nr:MBL fold metallo-hydrolase [Lachnospiraceae bacterium]
MTNNIEVFTQNSIRITGDKYVIYVDPFKMEEEPKNANYIFVTHDHYDHFSPNDIEKVANEETILVVPEKMLKKAKEAEGIVKEIFTVKPGTYHELDSLEFETVPSYNIMKPFHLKSAEWVGYILHVNGKRIYIAGDTDEIPEAKQVKCDIAMVPIGGTYTMDAKKAADLINIIRPEVAIPTHYGSIVGSPKDAEVFKSYVKDPVKVEIKIS